MRGMDINVLYNFTRQKKTFNFQLKIHMGNF